MKREWELRGGGINQTEAVSQCRKPLPWGKRACHKNEAGNLSFPSWHAVAESALRTHSNSVPLVQIFEHSPH